MRFPGSLVLVLAALAPTGCAGANAPTIASPPHHVLEPALEIDTPMSDQESVRFREASVLTTLGMVWISAAIDSGIPESEPFLLAALTSYDCAARAWTDLEPMTPTPSRRAVTLFWRADARNKSLRTRMILHRSDRARHRAPTADEIRSAIAAAIDARDAQQDPELAPIAAELVIAAADVAVELDDTPRRTEPSPQKLDIPNALLVELAALDRFVQTLPRAVATPQHRFELATTYLAYGHLAEARVHLNVLYPGACQSGVYGYRAWEALLWIADLSHDVAETKRLHDSVLVHSCTQ